MTSYQHFIIIGIAALCTALTRFLPFALFRSSRPTPRFLRYLGVALPPAVFGMLVVYCFKGVNVFEGNHGIPELIALASVILLHVPFRKTLLSIAGGTVVYIILVNLVFV